MNMMLNLGTLAVSLGVYFGMLYVVPKAVEKINKKELRRLTEILKDETVSNVEKNKVARTIFKEIVKGGDGGKTIKCVFWK